MGLAYCDEGQKLKEHPKGLHRSKELGGIFCAVIIMELKTETQRKLQ
jgi:hypothetical protein